MAADATLVVQPAPAPARIARKIWRLRRWPLIPMFFLVLFVITGVFAPLIAPHDPERGGLRDRNLPPAWEAGGSSEFLLGTDHLGRDMLSRVIFGARISLAVAGVTLGVGMVIGVASGLIAGWYGGWLDEFLMRIVDIKLAIPTILLALVLVLALGQSFLIIVAILAIAVWPRFARNVRGEVLQLKTMDFVALAKVAGASTPRILFIHIFPGVINTLIVLATLEVGIVILLESTLSFLGAGVPPPTPAWGSMVSDGRDRLAVAWWISTMPGLAIMLVVLSMNLFGDWLRDRLDPRLRQLNT
ncbi:MAG: ABC transporter permease [Chloroflexota bacterium]|nr:ABC transporter permease [Chloroflexota bacterium]MDE2959947.1 ABC transporter permease [Chloroflexota bacterium]